MIHNNLYPILQISISSNKILLAIFALLVVYILLMLILAFVYSKDKKRFWHRSP